MTRSRPKAVHTLFDAYDPDLPVVTEVRRLLQKLARQSQPGERSVFLITSASRGEGKTTIAGLLSLVSALVFRKRTLLIDADLRRPAMHDLLGLSQRPGLFDVLHGKVSIDVAIRATPVPALSALTSGRATGPMGEAYDDDEFQRLVASLRPRYDQIFIDSAPAVPVIEPLMMAEHADSILIVAMAGQTPVSMVRRLRQVLAPVNGKVAGVILNNASEGLPYYYEYKYYGYERTGTGRTRRTRSTEPTGGASAGDDDATGGTT
ncbi:MAG TPA: CpsD/CapB family tyrosine-protein kinase [Candidatus Eisenbacteria bacterium]